MTLKELVKTLEARRKGLAYRMWKGANLISASCFSKNYPESPENACPELYPPKTSIKMPDFLINKWLKRGGK